MRTCGSLKNQLCVSYWVTSAGIQNHFQCEQDKKHQFWFGNKQRHSEPANPPGYVSLLRLSSPDAGSPQSHRRPRHCWPGPLLRPGSPGHPRRKRCKGLRRPGWGPCIPARRGPSRPPACTSARPGKIGPPWRWTDRGRVWRNGWRWKQRGSGVS